MYNFIEMLSLPVYVSLKEKKKKLILNHTVKANPLECIFLMGTGLLLHSLNCVASGTLYFLRAEGNASQKE